MFERALAILGDVAESLNPETAPTLCDLADVYQRRQAFRKAEKLYRRGLYIFEYTHGPGHAQVADTVRKLAALYRTSHNYGEAEKFLQRLLFIQEHTLGVEHPDAQAVRVDLAALADARAQEELNR
jgi:tetratricopeptide (TPR) repeat protein